MLMTDRIDHLLTRPLLGIPVLLGILALVFLLTYKVGFPVQDRLETGNGFHSPPRRAGLSGAPRG